MGVPFLREYTLTIYRKQNVCFIVRYNVSVLVLFNSVRKQLKHKTKKPWNKRYAVQAEFCTRFFATRSISGLHVRVIKLTVRLKPSLQLLMQHVLF